ncbi:hypothetical protein FXN63_14050 [Pigmentiphaga aceris]|uniref:Uncharacterized protein n=1 Tax=Pigmentiphaga aceris TaxID=1940612 RepID=A0A5C0AWJ4_9BURK|nr:hypothetical protein [Pigmentiphaga aceris]QEI06832.1 hypothetical protein FXN63_14050 [Pigmentiphaga aceris]
MTNTAEDAFQAALRLDSAGDHAEAARCYALLVEDCEDARVFMAYGYCLQALSRWKASIPQFQRAIALKPAYCEGDTRLALATSLMNAGSKAKAIEQWRLAAAMAPEYPSYGAVQEAANAALAKHAGGGKRR